MNRFAVICEVSVSQPADCGLITCHPSHMAVNAFLKSRLKRVSLEDASEKPGLHCRVICARYLFIYLKDVFLFFFLIHFKADIKSCCLLV